MRPIQILPTVALLVPVCVANAASPGNAPQLPVTGTRIVNVASEPQLQSAVAAGNLKVYVRQRPGPANSLGHFKFDLPNGDGIYLHDTPKKELFAQDERNLSHGCVRLEDAPRLARWLLGKDPPAASAPEENVLLPEPVPIMISYLDPRSQSLLASLQ